MLTTTRRCIAIALVLSWAGCSASSPPRDRAQTPAHARAEARAAEAPAAEPPPTSVPRIEAAAPVPDLPPLVDPSSLPSDARPLAFLPRALARIPGRLLRRSRIERSFAPPDRENLVVTCWTDASLTWICLEEGEQRQCWTVAVEANTVPLPHAYVDEQGVFRAHVQLIRDGGSTIVDIVDGTATASQRQRGETTSSPREPPAPHDPPAFLAELRDLDLLAVRDGSVVGRAGTMVAYCSRAEQGGARECGAPVVVPGLEHARSKITDVDAYAYRGFWSLDLQWEERAGLRADIRNIDVLVRRTDTTLTPVASIPTLTTQQTQRSEGAEEYDVVSVSYEDIEPSYDESCLVFRRVEVRHELQDAEGEMHALPVRHRLVRAPDRVGVEGVDGFTTNMQGTWRILPEGGLARGPCHIEE